MREQGIGMLRLSSKERKKLEGTECCVFILFD